MMTTAVFGLIVGSFLNVVAARLPAHRSVLRPASACPGCGAPIKWRDNIPVLSFLMLRGRCRACGMAISWRYPATEVATAILWVVAYRIFGPSPHLAVAIVFLSTLVVITAIDLEHQIIPDVITLPGIVGGLVVNLATARVLWVESLLGVAVGGGLFFLIILISGGGMGGGDMKLGAMFGAFLGWKVTLLAIFVAVLIGGTLALALLLTGQMRRKDPLPFGPFLALGGAVGLLWGDRIVQWYVRGFIA